MYSVPRPPRTVNLYVVAVRSERCSQSNVPRCGAPLLGHQDPGSPPRRAIYFTTSVTLFYALRLAAAPSFREPGPCRSHPSDPLLCLSSALMPRCHPGCPLFITPSDSFLRPQLGVFLTSLSIPFPARCEVYSPDLTSPLNNVGDERGPVPREL